MLKETSKNLINIFTSKIIRRKLWPNQKYHKNDHIQCKLKWEKNIMFACVENLRTNHYVMALMQDQVLDQKFSKLMKRDSLHFVDVNTVKMKQENVTEVTVRYEFF
jgi:hypothetical protein